MRRRVAGLVAASALAFVAVPAAPASAVTCGDLDLVCAVVCNAAAKYGVKCGY